MKILYGLCMAAVIALVGSCTKVDKGFISPTMHYSINEFTAIRGRVANSYSLVGDGSTMPIKVKMLHAYDASGKIVDSLFSKTYPVSVWTAAYDNKIDVTYSAIMAKRKIVNMQAVSINESNGSFEVNPGTIYLPLGSYTFDIEVSNSVGTKVFEKAMTLILKDGKQIETTPETGAYSLSRLIANTAAGANNGVMFNGNNNPFVVETITRFADTPNTVIIKITDKDGVVFNPKKNEIMKRPNSGLNPNPPFLQNLQDYAPDTFTPTDTALTLKYPLVPFPIVTLGNGFNMYYRIPTAFVHMDSTTTWSSNTAGNYYKGTTDSHFRGYFKDDLYDYAVRIPMRVQVPGAYLINLKLLNATHR
ncbi:DUF5007 domain-containing protein [Chitinophagaceae bacterium LB-8]|uniref:DUF5007 domain-containing protein n=1 Tax=Paraflavisolibacter caeni TaxID=2982496 RepID=A0A9X2XSX4_9BACT|nr:DUF5007 domain-containing protein [Paraflavisolibacter caeni]MCU7547782.1 DUF5007 domain-containing protein [Paraflavisolibacter caeni]